ncbi:MAG: hypothetical protein FJZ90_15585 [Chloroflexi bacterium]|nr:hypothetical protein [Chloroflexota bacterium]
MWPRTALLVSAAVVALLPVLLLRWGRGTGHRARLLPLAGATLSVLAVYLWAESAPSQALARRLTAVGLGAALIGAFVPLGWHRAWIGAGAMVAGCSLLAAWLPPFSWETQGADIVWSLAAGFLSGCCLMPDVGRGQAGWRLARRVAQLALLLQATGLTMAAVRAQLSVGSYWGWTGDQCWRLCSAITTALVWMALSATERPWLARLALCSAAIASWVIVLAAPTALAGIPG